MSTRRNFLIAVTTTFAALTAGCRRVVCLGDESTCYTVTFLGGGIASTGDTPASIFDRIRTDWMERGAVGYFANGIVMNDGPTHVFAGGEQVGFFRLETLTAVEALGGESYGSLLVQAKEEASNAGVSDEELDRSEGVVVRDGEVIQITNPYAILEQGDVLFLYDPDYWVE